MVAARKKVPNTKIEPSKSPTFGLSTSDAPVKPVGETVGDRLAGLDVRAQSALLHEAFETDPLELDTPGPSPQRGGFVARFGWRAIKSALGLGVLVIAGVGPVQRLLEFSSVEAVVNARLVSLRAPIDGKIEDGDFAPTIGAVAPRGRFMLRISNSRADRARLDGLQRLVDQTEGERPGIARRLMRIKELHGQNSRAVACVSSRTNQPARRAYDGPEGAGLRHRGCRVRSCIDAYAYKIAGVIRSPDNGGGGKGGTGCESRSQTPKVSQSPAVRQ